MPKDSHLLPQHSQDLLRAARSGKIYKRSAPVEEEEADAEASLGDKPEKKDDDLKEKGYTVKAWKPVPRHLEGPDIEYLAKRRKGLVTLDAKLTIAGPTLTKATVKRIDAAGNEYVQDVVVPQGQKVEGEVISQTVIPDPSAAVLGDGSVAPTPIRRKGPPKRKPKGPGRGRKKKPIAPTSVPELPPVDGVVPTVEPSNGAGATDNKVRLITRYVAMEGMLIPKQDIKIENETTSTPANNEDTEMADGSMHDSDDEEGEEGEDGEDDDEDSIENQGSPSKTSRPTSSAPQRIPTMTEIPGIQKTDTEMSGTEAGALPPALHVDRDKLDFRSGSPLKNVALTTSDLTSPMGPSTAAVSPFPDPKPVPESQPVSETADPASLDKAMQEVIAESAPTELPPPPPEPTVAEMEASEDVRKEEEEEEEMLLDIIDKANNSEIGAEKELPKVSPEPIAEPVPEPETTAAEPNREPEIVPETAPGAAPEAAPTVSEEAPTEAIEPPAPVEPSPAESSPVAQPEQAPIPAEEDDDDFPDLLGDLEKQLNEPADAAPEAAPVLTGEAALPKKPVPAKPTEG